MASIRSKKYGTVTSDQSIDLVTKFGHVKSSAMLIIDSTFFRVEKKVTSGISWLGSNFLRYNDETRLLLVFHVNVHESKLYLSCD